MPSSFRINRLRPLTLEITTICPCLWVVLISPSSIPRLWNLARKFNFSAAAWNCMKLPDLAWKIAENPTSHGIGASFHFFLGQNFHFLSAEFSVVYLEQFSSAKFVFSKHRISIFEYRISIFFSTEFMKFAFSDRRVSIFGVRHTGGSD